MPKALFRTDKKGYNAIWDFGENFHYDSAQGRNNVGGFPANTRLYMVNHIGSDRGRGEVWAMSEFVYAPKSNLCFVSVPHFRFGLDCPIHRPSEWHIQINANI